MLVEGGLMGEKGGRGGCFRGAGLGVGYWGWGRWGGKLEEVTGQRKGVKWRWKWEEGRGGVRGNMNGKKIVSKMRE